VTGQHLTTLEFTNNCVAKSSKTKTCLLFWPWKDRDGNNYSGLWVNVLKPGPGVNPAKGSSPGFYRSTWINPGQPFFLLSLYCLFLYYFNLLFHSFLLAFIYCIAKELSFLWICLTSFFESLSPGMNTIHPAASGRLHLTS